MSVASALNPCHVDAPGRVTASERVTARITAAMSGTVAYLSFADREESVRGLPPRRPRQANLGRI